MSWYEHTFPFMKSSFTSSGSERKYEHNNFCKFAIEKLFLKNIGWIEYEIITYEIRLSFISKNLFLRP